MYFHPPALLVPIVRAYEGVLELRRVDNVETNHTLAFLIPNLVPPRALAGGRAGMAGLTNSNAHEVRRGHPTGFRVFG